MATMRSRSFTMRIPTVLMVELETEAKARCVRISALILERLRIPSGAVVSLGLAKSKTAAMPGPGRKGGGKAGKAPKITKAKAPTPSAGRRKKAEAASEAHPRDVTASLLPATMPVHTEFPSRAVAQRSPKAERARR